MVAAMVAAPVLDASWPGREHAFGRAARRIGGRVPPPPMQSSVPVRVSSRFRVALEGFTDFERDALTSFFRLAMRRVPTYLPAATPEQSDFLVVDTGHAAAVEMVLAAGRLSDTVFVGTAPPAGATACLKRPIDPMHIVRELDLLVAARGAPAAFEPADVPGAAGADTGVDLLLDDIAAEPWGQADAWADPHPIEPVAPHPAGGGAGRHVLVVEDSAIARKFLSMRLQRLGYRVEVAHHGEAAIQAIEDTAPGRASAAPASPAYAIVFIDVVLGPPGSIDGLRVCQHIKQRGGPTPAVVMVTGLGGAADRVRGRLAGCDAYLVKPLLETDFVRTLVAVDPAFERTGARPRRKSAER